MVSIVQRGRAWASSGSLLYARDDLVENNYIERQLAMGSSKQGVSQELAARLHVSLQPLFAVVIKDWPKVPSRVSLK